MDHSSLVGCCVLLLLTGASFGEEDRVRIGPDIKTEAKSVIENAEGSTFLMNDVVLEHGVVFAFSAYFVNPSRVYFQVWRPVNGSSTFQLVFQTSMAPTATEIREDFYIVSTFRDRCPVVRSGDKIGVYFPNQPPAISRYFDAQYPNTYKYDLKNASVLLQVKDIVTFDTLPFPYKINIQAWILKTNVSLEEETADDYVDCPRVLIPTYKTEPITISPGATGNTGPVGPRGLRGDPGGSGFDGATGATGPLGGVGATGMTGAQGFAGATGGAGPEGVIGLQGPMGATGPWGIIGDMGMVGPAGPPGPPGVAPSEASCDTRCMGSLTSEGFLIGMLIWLIVLSLVLLSICVCMVVLHMEVRSSLRKAEEIVLHSELSGRSPSKVPPLPASSEAQLRNNEYDFPAEQPEPTNFFDPSRSRMKDETVSSYSLDTIETTADAADDNNRKQSTGNASVEAPKSAATSGFRSPYTNRPTSEDEQMDDEQMKDERLNGEHVDDEQLNDEQEQPNHEQLFYEQLNEDARASI